MLPDVQEQPAAMHASPLSPHIAQVLELYTSHGSVLLVSLTKNLDHAHVCIYVCMGYVCVHALSSNN